MFGKLKSLFKKVEPEIVALVIIEPEPRILQKSSIEQLFKSLGLDAFAIEPKPSYFVIEAAGWSYFIFSVPERYTPVDSVKFNDLRMAQAVAAHRGFVGTECEKAPPGHDRKESRPLLSKLIARIIDDHSLALYEWTSQRLAWSLHEVAGSMLILKTKPEETSEFAETFQVTGAAHFHHNFSTGVMINPLGLRSIKSNANRREITGNDQPPLR